MLSSTCKSKTRAVLVDDHVLVRAGIRSLIEKISSLEVVGEAKDGREAIALVKEHKPDLVLMDIAMPGLNGLESTPRILKEFPEIRVIILSMHTNEEYVLQALRAGASGYLLKDAATIDLELAIQAVSKDETYLSPSISKKVIDDYLSRGKSFDSSLDQLTSRQREVLQLIAEGKSTKEIAFLLNVSTKTVEAHRAQLMERLGIHDISGLIKYAIRVGLIAVQM